MRRSAYTPPHRRNQSTTPFAPQVPSALGTDSRPKPLMSAMSLPVGMQGRSGWDAYLSNRKVREAEKGSGKSVRHTPLGAIVRAMLHMPKDLLEEVRIRQCARRSCHAWKWL